MEYIFHLTGENETLPKAEVLSVLESMHINFKVIHTYDQVLILEADDLGDVPKRLGMTHGIYEYIGSCPPNFKDILSLSKNATGYATDDFAVRIKRIKDNSQDIKRDVLEQQIGKVIGKRVNLSKPSCMVVGFLTNNFVLGILIHPIIGVKNPSRHPKERPFFHPGVLLPKTARTLVNLTRIKPGDNFIDPFCGTGSLLIEAALIGSRTFGFDIDSNMVSGSKRNLEYYGLKNFKIKRADARDLWKEYSNFFDAIATDPPYGISSSTKGLGLDELFKDSIECLYKMLKNGKYACLVSPHTVRVEELAETTGFCVIEIHYEKIHRSLTRKILVLQKWR